jgi:hypothetical protein
MRRAGELCCTRKSLKIGQASHPSRAAQTQ